MTSHANAFPHLAGIWSKVLAGAALSAVLVGGAAVVASFVNTGRIDDARAELRDLDKRQRELTKDVVGLRVDVGYSRRALDRLLWAQGIEPPPEDGYVQSGDVVDSDPTD